MKDQTWTRVCKVVGCHTMAHPQSDYCKKHMKIKTMSETYGDCSDHKCCEKCGFCINCGDCKKFGCGVKDGS